MGPGFQRDGNFCQEDGKFGLMEEFLEEEDKEVQACTKMQKYCMYYEGPRHTCGCPVRTLPVPVPDTLPFPATEANIPAFEKWIFERYVSSAFNIGEQQPLPMMDSSPPVKLLIEEDSEPKAITKASPIPINWLPTIKAELDKDVRLGVIAPVPENTPVTWCSSPQEIWRTKESNRSPPGQCSD